MPQSRRRRDSAPTIASPANDQIRYVKALYRAAVRQEERLFVVEGVRLLEDALKSGARPELVLVARAQLGRSPRGVALLERLARFRCLDVTESVLESLTDTVAPQGVIAAFPIPAPAEATPLGPIVLVLDRIRDPGNAGTILRSADASGVARTVAFVDSVDAFSPKVVRAGMGAHFRLQILDGMTWDRLLPRLGNRPRYLAVASGGTEYDRADWTQDSVLIVGGEAEGAGPEAESVATTRVSIPMAGSTESLNAAMAATVLLFEAARIRRGQSARAEIGPDVSAIAAAPAKTAGGYPRVKPRPGTPTGPRQPSRPAEAPRSHEKGSRTEDSRRTNAPAPRPDRGPGSPPGKPQGDKRQPRSRRPESGPSSPRPPRPRL